MSPGGLPDSTRALSSVRFARERLSPDRRGRGAPAWRYAMHQQPRATEQPRAAKIASRSHHRSGVAGRTVIFMRSASLTPPECLGAAGCLLRGTILAGFPGGSTRSIGQESRTRSVVARLPCDRPIERVLERLESPGRSDRPAILV